MSRTQRLFDLLQLLRCHKYPVAAATLADELNVSVRTIYRDIATLQSQGAEIEGTAGLGYLLKPNFMLPPLMFSYEELEALLLGAEWVTHQDDSAMTQAARHAIAKISAILPDTLKWQLERETFRVGPGLEKPPLLVDLALIRQAIRQESIIEIEYVDQQGNLTIRRLWPVLLGFFEACYMLVAWCENRQAFRHFRVDRIRTFHDTAQRYPRRQRDLVKAWQATQGVADKQTRY
ncbi:YafY family protein [Vibrio gazogenes]|uniref:Predicted DNA-binding transcriptional regulator YafY, contains an HTH and WYL domains n=1 Tax=Vibrio gazogenes DSM 21264 = NBRC 103151 TaxID=1123492 RepID=A0A1M5BPM3_VIBGA|nr:YafY family protein [Vibrio gazogenes]USP13712.1 YafY family transcriptional regulator [Vibrio gazogenes]SHF44355.1 Predicted DNA-binding transcriptional regulator YafY, contains an HTH and WYL domains [Vibrio gazogenes DSM 21264] [Vibrio gazogenes DSM 21264 = NBRC 103151]SJN54382.1 Bifunctional ligase/repressor BirA [Vibrio gazogenes]